jgi:predicted ATP-binding protein involved in virulence
MRIKEIKIEGLFGMFDHTIPLNMEERLSIVYGINGIGKTMVFKILDSLFNLDLNNVMALSKAPFVKLIINYQGGSILTLLNKPKKLEIYFEKNRITESYTISIEDMFKEESPEFEQISRIISRNIPALSKISANKYRIRNTNDIIEIEEAFERYAEIFPSSLLNINIPQLLKDILNQTQLFFIQTQRLIVFQPKLNNRLGDEISFEKEDSVSLYSTEIANIIKTKIKERDKLSNDLQQSLHKRILSNDVKTDYTIEQLNEVSTNIEKRIEQLKEVGLFEGIQMDNFKVTKDVDAVKRAILSVNIQDIQKTLAIFDDLYPKFQKFIEILNERRLSFKKITLSGNGFVFRNSKGKILSANDLSSGEQHELVLLYLLLFRIPENSLVLIDEPEISLHITWQKAFLEDMKDIIKLRNFDIVVATHSPAIINGNWDLTIKLDGNGENE